MARINQVMQIGEIKEELQFYIEDYAYTYLKKQRGKEKAKYFLYGHKEELDHVKKIYIYGIAKKPKMEQTYFKEYYPLGFIKLTGEDKTWISLKGQEEAITGFYVFYAPNQAMQEYLVDHREEEEEKTERRMKKLQEAELLPIKEKGITIRKKRLRKKGEELRNESVLFPLSGIAAACLVLFALTTANGREKIEVFKQIISETFSGDVSKQEENDFVIEEKKITEEENIVESDTAGIGQEVIEETVQNQVEDLHKQENSSIEENVSSAVLQEKNEPEEYIVKEGDTLAKICKNKYGSLGKMQEICTMNNIKNADYIAPGQKIYLP